MRFGIAFAVCVLSRAQSFEAASVKRSDPAGTEQSVGFEPGGRFVAKSLTLKGLIRMAYNVPGFQVSGGPKWIDADDYDVQTRAEGNPAAPVVRIMLQNLLAERFKLTLHKESRELPLYWLVVGKNGPKIRETAEETGPNRIRRGSLNSNTTMAGLARLFSLWLERVVIDKTGLEGKYEIKLEWAPEESSGEPEIGSQPGASLFSAVEAQLGLRLEPRKGALEILVIDSAEKPPGN